MNVDGRDCLPKAFLVSPCDEAANTFSNCDAERRLKMLNWPEMLHHAEDWANGFWTGAASASIIGIVAAAVALISRAI